MCSIGEDDFGDEGGLHAMIPDIVSVNSDLNSAIKLCSKCKKPEAVYKLQFRQAECRDCFLLYARHKFRAALGSSKVLPKDAKILVVFDGSDESVVLLDMLHHAQTQNTYKRLHCTAKVLYIDDFQLLKQNNVSEGDYKGFLEKIEVFLKRYTYFDSFIVPLVNVKELRNYITNIRNIKEQQYIFKFGEERQSLLNAINSIKSLTSRQDFVKYHRSKIIASVANHFSSKFAFICDTSSNLATNLLTAVALGRGGNAALDVALVDDRLGNNIKIVRPLKDLNSTEIDLYLKAQDLPSLQILRYGEEFGSTASLQNLTNSFINNLQENFSSTVSTVFRTGDKIAVNRDVISRLESLDINDTVNLEVQAQCCSFCNSFLDYHDSKTLLAIEFSRLVSESGCELDKYQDLNAKAKESVEGSIGKPYLKKLCHACRNICFDSPSEKLLM